MCWALYSGSDFPTKPVRCDFFYPHLTEDTETQRGSITCPESSLWLVIKLRLKPRTFWP